MRTLGVYAIIAAWMAIPVAAVVYFRGFKPPSEDVLALVVFMGLFTLMLWQKLDNIHQDIKRR